MTGFPGSPRLVKGGIAQVDPTSGTVVRMIVLQYNPDTLTRTLQVQSTGNAADRSEVLRLKAPPTETLKVDAELDAADQLEFPDKDSNRAAVEHGIHPQLAMLEALVYPTVRQLTATNNLAASGTLEIAPVEAPMTVFVWSKERIMPIKITDFSVTEEAFDPALNPLRAKVSIGMRVLNVNDVGFTHRAGSYYLTYHTRKEQLARRAPASVLSALGIGGFA